MNELEEERLSKLNTDAYIDYITSKEEKCICACHKTAFNSNVVHSPVIHDSTCCNKMNGTINDNKPKLYTEEEVLETIHRVQENAINAVLTGKEIFLDPRKYLPKR